MKQTYKIKRIKIKNARINLITTKWDGRQIWEKFLVN